MGVPCSIVSHPVWLAQVCVLLNNMEQVVQQQRQLEKMLIRAAKGGGDVDVSVCWA